MLSSLVGLFVCLSWCLLRFVPVLASALFRCFVAGSGVVWTTAGSTTQREPVCSVIAERHDDKLLKELLGDRFKHPRPKRTSLPKSSTLRDDGYFTLLVSLFGTT